VLSGIKMLIDESQESIPSNMYGILTPSTNSLRVPCTVCIVKITLLPLFPTKLREICATVYAQPKSPGGMDSTDKGRSG